ncbi:MAG: PAS domain-containing protein [Proteobacteria bacterium]|nr:PAS domain-containing protein [Pseudomonadota bacterium]
MIEHLTAEQLEALMDALPIEIVFVDEDDRLRYWNKPETRSGGGRSDMLGRDIRQCHKPESLPRLEQMLDDLKTGRKNEDEFWIEGLGNRIMNRFLAVRDKSGRYLGVLEYLLDFTAAEQLAESKKDSPVFRAR